MSKFGHGNAPKTLEALYKSIFIVKPMQIRSEIQDPKGYA